MVQEGILQLPCALKLSSKAHAPPLLLNTTTLILNKMHLVEVGGIQCELCYPGNGRYCNMP